MGTFMVNTMFVDDDEISRLGVPTAQAGARRDCTVMCEFV
jgi:hypothetical protein